MRPVHLLRHNSSLTDMAIDEGGIVWLGGRGRHAIYGFARDGSDVRTLGTFDSERTERIFLEGSYVYFSTLHGGSYSGDDALARMPREGGPVEVIAKRFGWLAAIFEGYAYGVSRDGRHGSETITRVPIAGGTPSVLWRRRIESGVDYVESVVVGPRGVYFAELGTHKIRKMPHEGGLAVDLVRTTYFTYALRLLGDRLYINGIERSIPTEGGEATNTSGEGLEPWCVAEDGDRLIALGRDSSKVPRMGVLDASGRWGRLIRIEHIWQRAAVADEDCVYYVRVDPSGESYFSAIPAPPR